MATIVSHFLLGWGALRFVEGDRNARRVTGPLVAGCLAMLPDVDSLLMPWIPYSAPWGHRGMTHSLAFATAAGLVAATGLAALARLAAAAGLDRRVAVPGGFAMLWLTLAAITASHGLLDALTDGGLGIAFFAPFDDTRYFLPVRPIPVSPITVNPFDPWVLRVLATEAVLLWPWAWLLATAHRPTTRAWRIVQVAAALASAGFWIARCR